MSSNHHTSIAVNPGCLFDGTARLGSAQPVDPEQPGAMYVLRADWAQSNRRVA